MRQIIFCFIMFQQYLSKVGSMYETKRWYNITIHWLLGRLVGRYRTRIFLSLLTGYLHKSNAGDKNGTKISSLVLCCTMEDCYANLIDKLISIAICRGVEHLNLETYLYSANDQRPSPAPYKFPLSLFADGKGLSVTKLILAECTLSIPVGFAGFKSLVELSFTEMHISEDMIQTHWKLPKSGMLPS